MTTRYPRRLSERECQDAIVDAATWAGWRVHHCRPARDRHDHYRTAIQGHAGFPDLVLVHRRVGVFFRELKAHTVLTEDQTLWGTALSAAGADWQLLRMPDQLDETKQWLIDTPRKAAGL